MSIKAISALSDEEFRVVLAEARSCNDFFRRIGVTSRSRHAVPALRARATALGIRPEYLFRAQCLLSASSDEEVAQAVASSRSYAEALRRLSYVAKGANYRSLRLRIEQLGLDTSHLKGQSWRRDVAGSRRSKDLERLLVRGTARSGQMLRRRLVAEGLLPDRCAGCEGASWMSQPMPLELDHINGDNTDNRLSNLRLLCCNCHALTPTYRGRNIVLRTRGRKESAEKV